MTEYKIKRHVLFRRNADGDVIIIAPDREYVRAALDTLSRDHVFRLWRWKRGVIAEQGDGRVLLPDGFESSYWGSGVDADVLAPGGAAEACAGCELSRDDCGGPATLTPRIDIEAPSPIHSWIRRETPEARDFAGDGDNGLVVLGDIASQAPDACRLMSPAPAQSLPGTIHKRHLRAAGLEPVSSVKAFIDDGDVDGEVERVISALGLGVNFSDADDVETRVHAGYYRSWRGVDAFPAYKSSIYDMTFDDRLVTTKTAMASYRGALAARTRRRDADHVRDHCQRCVYGCERPPRWGVKEQPLQLDRVLADAGGGTLTHDHRQWLAAFTITGIKARFRAGGSGRRRWGIGNRPERMDDGRLGIRVVSIVPPYPALFTLPVDDYWRQAHAGVAAPEYLAKYDDGRMPRIASGVSDRDARIASWALDALCREFKHDQGRFDIHGQDRRLSRNDVLAIEIDDSLSTITVASDTCASARGGFMSRGSSITVADRPRFTTTYHAPFAHDIWTHLRITPGACRGRGPRR